MKSWREKFQAMAVAVAFAEAREWEAAASLMEQFEDHRQARLIHVKKRPDRRPRKLIFRS